MHLLMYFLQQHFGTCFVVSECKVELFNILGCQSTINESSKIFCMLVRQVASNPNDLTHFMLIPDRRKFKNCICIIEPLISSLSLFFTLLMLNFSGRGTSSEFICDPCPSGLDGDGQTCYDVNECLVDQPCEHMCENTVGSFLYVPNYYYYQ